ncbi:MAG: hypothetical protein ACLFQB_11990 [Chitinispirillaceae bacterium]
MKRIISTAAAAIKASSVQIIILFHDSNLKHKRKRRYKHEKL